MTAEGGKWNVGGRICSATLFALQVLAARCEVKKLFPVRFDAVLRLQFITAMKISLRTRILGAMLFGFVLPCLLGLLLLARSTLQYGRERHGVLYQTAALDLSHSLAILTNDEIDKINDWTVLSTLASEISRADTLATSPPADYLRAAQRGDQIWANDTANVRKKLLASPLSRQLKAFARLDPLWREIFVTGAQGQLIAATNVTSDFRQDDEAWWQSAHKLSGRVAHVEGIGFDRSANAYALEVSFPLRAGGKATGPILGVLKGVLDVSQLFARVPPAMAEAGLRREVVLADGKILAHLEDSSYRPLSAQLSGPDLARLDLKTDLNLNGRNERGGWAAARFGEGKGEAGDENVRLAGFAPLDFAHANLDLVALRGLTPMTVVISNDEARVLAPLYARFWILLGGGVMLLALCLGAGWQALNRSILAPLATVRSATHQLAAQAQSEAADEDEEDQPLSDSSALPDSVGAALVAQLARVQTGDEIGELAHDFATMARRVVNYQSHLEHEVAMKTGAIERDLQLARYFQESLLPRKYPVVPPPSEHGALNLSFHHIYQPALSVGGDFFDIFKVSEQCAGIFIADVMGHGARSALVTAILRTLLQDLAEEGENPARLLQLVNRHFYDIVSNAGSFVFATACCLTIDCAKRQARFASAGHPPPFILDRIGGILEELVPPSSPDNPQSNAALGLEKDTVYDVMQIPIQAGQTFVLYTDGVPEAPAPNGEEYGEERLSELLGAQARSGAPGVCRAILGEVQQWLDGRPAPDDICVIEIEIGAPSAFVETKPLENAATTL